MVALSITSAILTQPKLLALTESQAAVLRAVQQAWPQTPSILIGAVALGCHVRMERQTVDVDVAVAVPLEDFGAELVALPGWQRHPSIEHRFLSPDGQTLDVLPAAPNLRAKGKVTWSSGFAMSLVGFELAFRSVEQRQVPGEPRLLVSVPSAPAIALLKMRAWLDRPAERRKDLGDLALLFEQYVDDADPRRFDGEVVELGLQFEQAAPYLLGKDLGRATSTSERELVRSFLKRVQPGQLERVQRFDAQGHHGAHGAFTRGFESVDRAGTHLKEGE